jgi:hypothetical protein
MMPPYEGLIMVDYLPSRAFSQRENIYKGSPTIRKQPDYLVRENENNSVLSEKSGKN